MLKNIVRYETKIDEWQTDFNFMPETPLPIIKEMVFQFLKYVGQIEDAAKAQQPSEPREEEKAELIIDEPKSE